MALDEEIVIDFDRTDPLALHGWHISTRHPGGIWEAEDPHGQFWWLAPEDEVWYLLFMRREAEQLPSGDARREAFDDWEAFRALWPRLRGVLGRLMRPGGAGERAAAAEALKKLCFRHCREIGDVVTREAPSYEDERGQSAAVSGARATLELVYWHGRWHFPDRPAFDDRGWQALMDAGPDRPFRSEPPWKRGCP